MDRSQIHFLKFLLEAYEGAAVLSTVDKAAGLVTLLIAPGREGEVTALVADLKQRILIEPMPTEEHSTSNARILNDI